MGLGKTVIWLSNKAFPNMYFPRQVYVYRTRGVASQYKSLLSTPRRILYAWEETEWEVYEATAATPRTTSIKK